MRQAGVIAAAGIVALETMVERLADDHVRARRLADALARALAGQRRPRDDPHEHRVRRSRARCPIDFVDRLGRGAACASGTIDPRTVRLVTHKDVDDDAITAHDRRVRRARKPADDGRTTTTPGAGARDLRASRRSRDLGRGHARPLGRRGRRGARRRHDARRQGHERSRRRSRRARARSGSRRPRPRRGCSGSPSTIISTIPTVRSPTTAPLRLELVRLIRAVRPDVVCCPDPTAVFFGDALRQPSRSSRHRLGDARRGRARGRQPALLPRAAPPRASTTHQVRALYLSGTLRAERLGRHRRDARTQDRGAVLSREPARRDRRLVPRLPARDCDRRRPASRACTFAEAFRRIALA